MQSSKTQKLPFTSKQLINILAYSLLTTAIFINSGCNQSNQNHSTANSDSTSLTAKSKFEYYLQKNKASNNPLNERYKNIRQRILTELKTNKLYNILVNQKVVNQSYLIVLQVAGNSMISEQDSTFAIEDDFEKKLKEIPGALKFTINIIQLDMYGGVPNEILDVYSRYTDEFKVSGNKGDHIYRAGGNGDTVIHDNFTLAEGLTVFHYKYPSILDDYYQAIADGFTHWQGGEGVTFRYAYLNTKSAFNQYLGENYPSSKNYIKYDLITTASNLYAEYDANEVNADDKYKNKQIAVKGIITKIAKDIMDDPYITLSTGDFSEIQCSFKSSEQLKTLSKGDNVTVVGKCTGKMSIVVGLTNCKLF